MSEDYIPEWQKKDISVTLGFDPFVFYRIDDVGYENDSLYDFIDYFLSRDIPFVAGVIPYEIKNMDDYLINLLRDDQILLMQHGFKHCVNFKRNDLDYGEFSTLIPFETNLRRLNNGWKLFNKTFLSYEKCFIPPRHCFPQLDTLLDEKYKIVSGYGDRIELIKNKLLSIPVNIDPIQDYSQKLIFPEEELTDMIQQRLSRQGYLGILLHHNYMNNNKIMGFFNQIIEKEDIPILNLRRFLYDEDIYCTDNIQ